MTGKYITGNGIASQVCNDPKQIAVFEKVFNCRLYGSFNIKLYENMPKDSYCIKHNKSQFYLVKISRTFDSVIGWALRWEGSKMPDNIIEVYTKSLIPDNLKEGVLEIQFFNKWNDEYIQEWQKDKYWFQGFDWLKEKRSDSALIWDYLKDNDYSNKTVFDLGCNFGYFSFKAAQNGAIVTGIDKDESNINRAIEINENIEMTDVDFHCTDAFVWVNYDYIFCLSMIHQIDPEYKELQKYIKCLKNKCKVLYLELINPPLAGHLIKPDIDKIVGGQELLHYQHKIRRERSLYRL